MSDNKKTITGDEPDVVVTDVVKDAPAPEVPPKIRTKKRRSVPRFVHRWIIRLALVAVAAAVVMLFWPQISDILGLSTDYTIEMQNAILGETRSKTELVVMEQDAQVVTEISNSIFNWEIFKKTKTIYMYGTGVFTVDLGALVATDVTVDPEARTVTVAVPHATLKYVNIDLTKSQFDETERGLLAFGEIKLTQEQQALLNESTVITMRSKLDTAENQAKADDYAAKNITALFAPLVTSVASDYTIVVTAKPSV